MKVLCDTNIFIHYFNGDKATQIEIDKIGLANILMPDVTKMELFRGMENKNKMQWMVSRVRHFNLVRINADVSELAIQLVQQYSLSHGLTIPDALIGSMAISYDFPLFTYNTKDFRYLPDLQLY